MKEKFKKFIFGIRKNYYENKDHTDKCISCPLDQVQFKKWNKK